MLLTLLYRNTAILPITAINLQILLVRAHIHTDPRRIRGQRQDNQIGGFGGGVARAVEDEGVVVADAAEAAGVVCGEDVGANLFGGREVEDGVGDGVKGAGGDEDVVNADVARAVGHVQSVVEDCGVCRVDEGAEVPVNVVGEHDWGRSVEGDGDETAGPLRAGGDCVGGVGYDIAGEAFEGFVEEGEGDGGGVGGYDGPVSLIVADDTAVEGVLSVVLVFGNVRCDAVHGEGAVLDAVGISTDYGAEVGVVCFGVSEILGPIVIPKDDILRIAILVVDVKIGEACAVGYEGCIDAWRGDGVFVKWRRGRG